MFFELSFKSGKPAYLQIIEQVKTALATGGLRAGDQLPSIRALAEELRINRNTVAKAYSELEHEGVVATEQGRGVFCVEGGSRLDAGARRRLVIEALDAAIVKAYHLKISDRELMELLEKRLKAFEARLGKAASEE